MRGAGAEDERIVSSTPSRRRSYRDSVGSMAWGLTWSIAICRLSVMRMYFHFRSYSAQVGKYALDRYREKTEHADEDPERVLALEMLRLSARAGVCAAAALSQLHYYDALDAQAAFDVLCFRALRGWMEPTALENYIFPAPSRVHHQRPRLRPSRPIQDLTRCCSEPLCKCVQILPTRAQKSGNSGVVSNFRLELCDVGCNLDVSLSLDLLLCVDRS